MTRYAIPAGQKDAYLVIQYGYPWPWMTVSTDPFSGLPLFLALGTAPRIDYWAFAANFGIYTFLLLGLMWTIILLMTSLRRRVPGYAGLK